MKAHSILLLSILTIVCVANLGDDDLSKAIDCAIFNKQDDIRAILEGSSMNRTPLMHADDCFASKRTAKYPSKVTEGGTLFTILTITHEIRFTTTTAECFDDRFKMVVEILTVELERAYSTHIKARYISPMSTRNGETIKRDPFSMLEEGTIDLILVGFCETGSSQFNTHVHQTKHGIIRTDGFRKSCSLDALDLSFYAIEEHKIFDITTLRKTLAFFPHAKIMTASQWEANLVKNMLGLSAESRGDDASIATLRENSGEFAALLATHILSKDDRKMARVKHIPTGMKIPAYIYTRNENEKIFDDTAWYFQGNAQLMAKVNKFIRLAQDKNTAKGFGHINDFNFLGNCLEAGTSDDVISDDQPIGTLKNILDNGIIRIGYVETDAFPLLSATKKQKLKRTFSDAEETIFDDSGNIISATNEEGNVKGTIVEIEKDIIEQLAIVYKLQNWIKIKRKVYKTNAELFSALEQGKIDATTAGQPQSSTVHQMPSRWEFRRSCSLLSYNLMLYTKRRPDVKTVDDFAKYIKRSKHKKIIVANNALRDTISELFPSAEVSVVKNLRESIHSLHSKSNLLAIVPVYRLEYSHVTVSEIQLPVSVPVGMFFRKDKIPSCGDGVVDTELGEECDSGKGCKKCKCNAPYFPTNPPGSGCITSSFELYSTGIIGVLFIMSGGGVIYLLTVAFGKKYLQLQRYKDGRYDV